MSQKKQSLAYIISASSVGTLIEWYDFYIFGSLATVLSTKFFPTDNPTAAFLNTLATFAAGFVVRPFGALVFGRLGDLIGRKYTFMVTLMLMGGATFAIGLVPSYATIGGWAPFIVLTLRLLQGLALGGEYGGAATYVAEHSPAERRGFFTSWIQTTATVGLVISLGVIMLTRSSMSKEAFDDYGWRVPFLLSIIMVGISFLIRRNMEESPMFEKAKKDGAISTNPLKESFGNKLNLKFVLLALFGATMGQGLVWYTGQFYAQTFLLKICNLDDIQTNTILVIGLLLGTPLFIFFGALSDKIGRKGIMLAGMAIAVFAYRPIFDKMYETVSVKNKEVVAGSEKIEETKALNAKSTVDSLITTTTTRSYTDGATYKKVSKLVVLADKTAEAPKADVKETITINDSDKWTLIGMVFLLISFVTMAYGPIAAFLVELFPTKIRYTSMSLPYHIGNGIFGGLMPAIATFLVTTAKDTNKAAEEAGQVASIAKPYLEGLNYPIALVSVCVVIGIIYIKGDKKHA
ncbi:MFS transporter [Aquirufa sp. LEPPI-3A]|uniref:MFS transporter n=1 Tax=Aquirufa regiilacus TaxID=3024868 RepID=UPI0028DE0F44|nr:MFS transporter [Aquirufa sp. LEPPI-3A]MDT8887482.1 MFS transporter [Aquirufa sp. LEPPI-3A]